MSFDHWWFSSLLSPMEEARLRPLFADADRRAVLSAESEEAVRYWQAHPESFSQNWECSLSPDERKAHGERYNRFVWAFNVTSYEELGKEVLNSLSNETLFRFISIRRCSPGAVLWHSLGYERASRLPGRMGNLFLAAGQVADALKQTSEAMCDLVLSEAVSRGMELAGHSNEEKEIVAVISHLPDGLQRALESNAGFIAVARPQL